MKTFSERLKFALSYIDGGTQASLVRFCQVKPSSVCEWFNERSKSMGGRQLLLASEYLGVNPKWLVDGIGPMRPGVQATTSTVLPMEEPAPLKTDWPFKSITRDEWKSIPFQTRNLLEQQIKSLIPTTTRQQKRA
jgi:hypothetical protein